MRLAASPGQLSLSSRPLARALASEGWPLWLLITYMMFEYVRPQTAYPALDIFPWPLTTLILTALSVALDKRTIRVRSSVHLFLLLFTAIVLLSSIAAYYPQESFKNLEVYLSWIVVYFLIIKIVTTETRVLLFFLAFVLFNFKMSLFATREWAAIGFSFRDWGVGGAPGWFQNSGEFGIEMCVFFPIILYLTLGLRPHLSRWKILGLLAITATALMGMIASSSRGALLGGAATMAFMLLTSKHRARAAVLGGIVAAAVFLLIPPESKERFATAGDDDTSTLRLTYWKRGITMTNDHPLLGVGYNNWRAYYSQTYSDRMQDPHNIFIQASAELGYLGLGSFLLLIAATFKVNSDSRKAARNLGDSGHFLSSLTKGLDGALIGYIVSGFFVTVLYYPFFWINLAMTVTVATATRRKLRDARGLVHTTFVAPLTLQH